MAAMEVVETVLEVTGLGVRVVMVRVQVRG